MQALLQVAVLVFVVSSMLAMGLSLSVSQIVAPLRSVRLVVAALAVNFVAVPAIAYGIDAVLDLDEGLSIGLIVLATAAGAPFLPKLAGVARGDAAFSVGLMVLLMVTTVVYMPIVLPVLIDGVNVDAWEIASSLIFLMLLPLAIGIVVRGRYASLASGFEPLMATTSTVALAILVAGGILVSFDEIVDLIGTRGILAILVFLAASFTLGWFTAGSDPAMRSVHGLGTAQRNISAAFVVAAQNFSDVPSTLTFLLVAALVGLVALMPLAAEIGRRRAPEAAS